MSSMDNFIDEWYDAALAKGQGFKTEEERQEYIKSLGDPEDHPMFITDSEKMAKHPLAAAFRELKEEDKTSYELVIMYKEEGNTLVKRGDKEGWEEAIARYTHSLTFIDGAIEEFKALDIAAKATDPAPASAHAPAAVIEEEDAVEEIKSASVLQFEQEQANYNATQQAKAEQAKMNQAKIELARCAKGHERGSKPVKVELSNPNLTFKDDNVNSTPEEIQAKKDKILNEMEGHQGENVLTYEEVVRQSNLREANIKAQAAGVNLENVEQTRSQILGNRAMAQLSLKNYGSCIKDCDVALYFWPQNIKAYYRKCKALVGLHKYQLCIECYEKCKKDCICESSTKAELKAFGEVEKLLEQSKDHLKRKEKDHLRAVVAADRKGREVTNIYNVCTGPKYRMKLGVPPGMQVPVLPPITASMADDDGALTEPSFSKRILTGNASSYFEDSDGEKEPVRKTATDTQYLQQLQHSCPFEDDEAPGNLLFPAVFLYPQYNQLDIIQGCETHAMLVDHLAQMFPEEEQGQKGAVAPWDIKNEYHVSKLVCYLHLNGSSGAALTSQQWLHFYDVDTPYVASPTEADACADATRLAYEKDKFAMVHLGCTIEQMLACDMHVVPGGILHVLVFVNKSKSHKRFLQSNRKNRSKMYSLMPTGVLQEQL